MLGNLIKYELKATGRKLLPLYIALLAFALINNLLIGNGFVIEDSSLGAISMMISIFAYVCIAIAIFIITFFIIVQRFYKNLLGDEGYLMNTLPVPTWMNILSKLSVSIIWNIVSAAVTVSSIIIMVISEDAFFEFFSIIDNLKYYLSEGSFASILGIILYLFLSMIVSTLTLYLSLAVGHIFNKRKILISFGAFIGINILVNIIREITSVNSLTMIYLNGLSNLTALLIFDLVLAMVLFIGCNYILKNKLNLE